MHGQGGVTGAAGGPVTLRHRDSVNPDFAGYLRTLASISDWVRDGELNSTPSRAPCWLAFAITPLEYMIRPKIHDAEEDDNDDRRHQGHFHQRQTPF